MARLTCTIVTPEATALNRQADFVALPLYDGEIGIGPGHAPLIGRLGFGELRVSEGERTQRFYVDGGFVEVIGDKVTVLTNRALAAEKLDPAAAQRQLDEALRRKANTAGLLELRDRQIAQARGQLRVARRAEA